MSPALKKRKKSQPSNPSPIAPPTLRPAPPLSALAARRAAAALASSVTALPAKVVLETPPQPPSPIASTSSAEPSQFDHDHNDHHDAQSDPEDLKPPQLTPSKKSRRRAAAKGKGKDKDANSRYWDNGLPDMETSNRVTFLNSTGHAGWTPDEAPREQSRGAGTRATMGGGEPGHLGEFEMFGEELDSDGGEEEDQSFMNEQRELVLGHPSSRRGVWRQEEDDERPSPRSQERSNGRRKDRSSTHASNAIPAAMSTFLPIRDHNVVLVQTDVLRTIFDDVSEGETAALISLREGENLIFSGTCSLYPLDTPLSVFNATLPPCSFSTDCHAIFAPTCYPLPVITPVIPLSASTSPSLSSLFARLQSVLPKDNTYISRFLIRELRTGIEGMTRAVPGFNNIWKGDDCGWGVQGFFPILSQTGHRPHILPPSWDQSLSSAVPAPKLGSSVSHTHQHDSDSDDSDSDDSDEDEDDEDEIRYRPFVALVKGPKRSGKSGFARSLVNRLFANYRFVAYLEADVGQSEFGMEGAVSLVVLEKPLLGPPFTHPSIPLRSHYLGSPSPRQNPTHYLACIADLLETYRLTLQYPPVLPAHLTSSSSVESSTTTPIDSRNVSTIPLVINTQGWVKGLGMDLLKKIEAMAEVTHEFEFEVLGGEDEAGGSWEGKIPLEGGWGRLRDRLPGQEYDDDDEEEVGESQGYRPSTGNVGNKSGPHRYRLQSILDNTLSSRYTATDLRTLALLTYLHARFPTLPRSIHTSAMGPPPTFTVSTLAAGWDFSLPLVARRPWSVDWTKALDAIHLVGPGAEEVVEDEILLVLNSSLVGLVREDEPSSTTSASSSSSSSSLSNPLPPYVRDRAAPSPSTSSLLGFALIRSAPPPSLSTSDLVPLSSSSTTLQILTPLPGVLLPTTRVLVKGETELPIAGMLDWRQADAHLKEDNEGGMMMMCGVRREDVPFLVWGKESEGVVGGGKRKVRRNVGRRG